MMQTVHFGAGNIGRGFIGEVLNKNYSSIAFVDVNEEVIETLNARREYTIELAQEKKEAITIDHVYGINNAKDPEAVVAALVEADFVTTAIGPNILPLIAPLIAQGIRERKTRQIEAKLDIVACENMIGGSTFLKQEVVKHISDKETLEYVHEHIGFPDAAVDRIVPLQAHEDILKVTVEPYKEWVISTDGLKNTEVRLNGIRYVEDLAPYIERKLFTVNTGHATTAYHGRDAGYQTIAAALKDQRVFAKVEETLKETGALMIEKWGFAEKAHQTYIEKILSRFQNPQLSDSITRVGRTPIRKLGYDERFIRPLREAFARGLKIDALVETIGKVLAYNDPNDEESVKLQNILKNQSVEETVQQITKLEDQTLIAQIAQSYRQLKIEE